MFTKYLSKISAIAIAGVVAFSFTACSKSTASLDTLPMGAEIPVED
mgnify:CR=1 FL=1